MITSPPAGFAFARMQFPGRNALFYLLLSGRLPPAEAFIIPLYDNLRTVGLTDKYRALILPQTAQSLAFGIFWIRSHRQAEERCTFPTRWCEKRFSAAQGVRLRPAGVRRMAVHPRCAKGREGCPFACPKLMPLDFYREPKIVLKCKLPLGLLDQAGTSRRCPPSPD